MDKKLKQNNDYQPLLKEDSLSDLVSQDDDTPVKRPASLREIAAQQRERITARGPHGSIVSYPRNFVIQYEQLRFGKQIGSGGTSIVYRGFFSGQQVAIKSFRVEMLTAEYVERFAQEMSFSAKLHHEHVVKCIGMCVLPPTICIVTEFMERGSLFRILTAEMKSLTYALRVSMARDAASGIAFLHSHKPPIIHRDIKSLNFLVTANYVCKLADFGETRELVEEADGGVMMTKNRGTPHWCAPEVFLVSDYDEKIDVYSLGIVLWEIVTSQRPYEGTSPWLIPAMVIEKNERPPIPSFVPQGYANLIRSCWQRNPRDRPSAKQVVVELERLLSLAPRDGSWPQS